MTRTKAETKRGPAVHRLTVAPNGTLCGLSLTATRKVTNHQQRVTCKRCRAAWRAGKNIEELGAGSGRRGT